jgi:hypothetical protein
MTICFSRCIKIESSIKQFDLISTRKGECRIKIDGSFGQLWIKYPIFDQIGHLHAIKTLKVIY